MNEKPIKIFITYAHEDDRYKRKLEKHLAVMKQNREIVSWSDNKMLPGDKWREKISKNIDDSDILLFLTSAQSLASENCKKELSEALNKDISLISIILEYCDWKNHKISNFQALPTDEQRDLKPVCDWRPQSKAWQTVIDGIRTKVKALKGQASSPPTPHTDTGRWLQHGNASLFLGQFQFAIDAYDEAVRINPQDTKTYYNRGNAKYEIRECQETMADYDQANPQLADAYNNRGTTRSDFNQCREAVADYDQAIYLNSQFADVYHNRGIAKYELKEYQEAIVDFDQAIRINPKFAKAYTNRGEAYLCCGKWDEAREDLIKAKEMGVDIVSAFRNTYPSFEDFEKKFQIKLPDDIKKLLSDGGD